MHEIDDVGYCTHCGNKTTQALKGECSHLHIEDGSSRHFFFTQCLTCADGLIYRLIDPNGSSMPSLSHGNFQLKNYELVWPVAKKLHCCVPEKISRIYSEAAAIKLLAPNAFANQIRRCLEAICHDRGATHHILAKNLKELAERGEIPNTLSEMSDVLRKLGNIGSHASDEEISPAYVEVIDEFLSAIIEYVYIAPHKVSEFKKTLDLVQTKI